MKASIILIALIFSLTHTAFSGEVEFIYSFGKPTVKTTGEYQSLNFENTMLTALPGQPAMPYHQVKLLLPPGESAQSLEIIFSGETPIPGKFNIFPHQEVQPISTGKSGHFIKDEAIYNRNVNFPSNPKGQLITAFLNGRSFALSSFTPVQYNPVTGKASYYASAKVIVHTQADQKSQAALSNLSVNSQQASRLADNKETDNLYRASRQPTTDGYELLIICTSAYSTAFENYRASYLKQGLRSQVKTLESITSTISGIDAPDKIRNYIKQEYQLHGIEYVLLAGDVELIPYRGFYCYVKSSSVYQSSNIPADLYYSALDGNWNSDGDSKWGEPADTLAPFNPEEADLLPEISVARMPFSNLTELNSMLHKSYSYQFSPVDGEFRNIILAGEYLFAAPYLTWGSYYMELLLGHRTDNGYTTTGIPTTYPVDKMYDETATWSKQDLMNHLNMGRPMLNHTGHANQTFVMKMYNADITNANFAGLNGTTHNYTIVNTHGCDCGAFDYNDCIAEKMVTIDNFAVAFIGNSRYGWFNEGTNEGPSAHLHREYMDALYSDSLNRIGRAHTESKIATAPWVTAPGQWEPGALRWCFYDCTVLGDPAMAVFTDNPITIQTDYSSTSVGVTSLDVSVSSEGIPIQGLSCVVLENGVMLGKALTNASGIATVVLNPAVSNPAEVQLVVSGYNCVPATYNLTAKTYTWNVSSGNWKTPSSWLPVRTNPAANDILVFDGSIQANASVSLDFTTAENLGKLQIINNTNVTLTAAASRKVNIGTPSSISPHFEIGAGSTLNVNASNPVSINLPAGCVASVSGNMVFQNAAHRLTANSENAIAFINGASFTAGSTFSGNAFGTGTSNSVVFNAGSSYVQSGGNSPFGLVSPASVIVFNSGSLYKFNAAVGAPEFSGRLYGNLEINSSSAALNSLSGTGGTSVKDLTITSGNCGFNLTGGIKIAGNLTVLSGAQLSFSPSTVDSVHFNGTSTQSISGGGGITFNANSVLNIHNNTGINLGSDITINGKLALKSGLFNIGNGNLILGVNAAIAGTPSAANMVVACGNGEFRKFFASSGSFTYPIGDNTGTPEYSPVTLTFISGTFSAGAYSGIRLANAATSGTANSYLNRNWTVTSSGIGSFTCDARFDYVAADVNGTESDILCMQFLPIDTLIHNSANCSQHCLTASGLSSFGVFTGASTTKKLMLTSIFPQGLYSSNGVLRQANDNLGAHWPTGVADHITVELHDASNYSTIVYTATDVSLNTSGMATVSIPAIYSGSYYITIKHRNSLKTVSATAVSFAGNIINKSFGSPEEVFGGNLRQMGDSGYAIYSGDVNQDGFINQLDMTLVEND
ncbi:MAG: C25 family cysteine peptidase, partial [Bacteroidales bacterium]